MLIQLTSILPYTFAAEYNDSCQSLSKLCLKYQLVPVFLLRRDTWF